MTDCTEYEVLLSLRLDGELTPEEDARLTAHLAACPSCQALAAELEALHSELEAIAPIPPASLAETVMEQVRAEARPIPFPAKPKTGKQWKRYGALAALLTLVILGGSFFAASPFSPFHPAGSAPDAETAAVTEEMLPAEAAEDTPAEAVPAEEKAEPAEAGDLESSTSSGAGSTAYDYSAGSAPTAATAHSSPAETEEDAPECVEAPALESAADEAPAEAAPVETESPKAANTAAVSLSRPQAQSLLKAKLNAEGGDWTITDSRQSADGTAWLFTAEDSASPLPHRFSVSIPDGQVTELSPSD